MNKGKISIIAIVLIIYALIITLVDNSGINYLNHPFMFFFFSPVGLAFVAVLAATWLSSG